jgi:hypothetical protein
MRSSADTGDSCSIKTTTHGATTITTTDDDGTAAHFEIAADGNIILDAAGDIALEAAGNDVTVDSENLTIESATASKPVVGIKSTNNGSNCGSLQFTKDNGVAAVDGQQLGNILFTGEDSGQNATDYAKIEATISESADTDEAGKLSLYVAESDGTNTALTAGLVLEGEHATDGQVDVTIGAGAASTTTIAGVLRPVGQIQVISANFKDNQGTAETFIPLSAQPEEKTGFGNEQTILLMPSGGYVKEIIVRAAYSTYTSENIVYKIYRRPKNKKVNGSTQIGSDITVAAPTQNTTDDNNTRSTGDLGTTYGYTKWDMLGISMTHQSTGPTATSDKTYITVVLENDLTDLGY